MALNSKSGAVGSLTRTADRTPSPGRYCRSVIRRGRTNRSCLFLSTRRVCSGRQEIRWRSNRGERLYVSRMSAGHLSTTGEQDTLPRSTATFNPPAVDLAPAARIAGDVAGRRARLIGQSKTRRGAAECRFQTVADGKRACNVRVARAPATGVVCGRAHVPTPR